MIEQATEHVTIMVSPEMVELLKNWSAPVRVKIASSPQGQYEMHIQTVERGFDEQASS